MKKTHQDYADVCRIKHSYPSKTDWMLSLFRLTPEIVSLQDHKSYLSQPHLRKGVLSQSRHQLPNLVAFIS